MKRLLTTMVFATLVVGCAVLDEDVKKSKPSHIDIIESFEDCTLNQDGYCYGYRSQVLDYEYLYNDEWGTWSGFAPSACFDMDDASYDNQYSVYNSKAALGNQFVMYYYDSYNPPTDILCRYHGDYQFRGVRLNLSTICYKTIMDGNSFARAFDEGDYLKVSFIALGENKVEGDVVEYYAVDYRDGKRFIAENWDYVDLSALHGKLWGLRIRIETTDVGAYGANTPLYICMDDLAYTVDM